MALGQLFSSSVFNSCFLQVLSTNTAEPKNNYYTLPRSKQYKVSLILVTVNQNSEQFNSGSTAHIPHCMKWPHFLCSRDKSQNVDAIISVVVDLHLTASSQNLKSFFFIDTVMKYTKRMLNLSEAFR